MKKFDLIQRILASGALAVVRAKPKRVLEIAEGIVGGGIARDSDRDSGTKCHSGGDKSDLEPRGDTNCLGVCGGTAAFSDAG